MQHYFLNESLEIGKQVELSDEIKKHWIRVMRAKENDAAEFVDDQQQLFLGELINSEDGTVEILKQINKDVEMPINVTIACGLSKNGKAELIVQKATELGAHQIVFLPMDWSVAKWNQKANKKIERLQKIAKSAAEQSHRNVIPNIKYLNKLEDLAELNFTQKIVAYEESAKEGESSKLVQVLHGLGNNDNLLALFGPEGGVSPEEIEKLSKSGFTKVGLGPRILRTETAPFYLLSAASVLSELKQV